MGTDELLKSKSSDYCFGQGKFYIFETVADILDLPVEKVFEVFMTTKLLRLTSLLKKEAAGEAPNHEGVLDTIQDMKGYAELFEEWYRKKQE